MSAEKALLYFMESILEYKLYNLLQSIKKQVPGNIFTGIGIVLYDSLDNLPFFKLSSNSVVERGVELSDSILEASLATNINHDGFNLVNRNFEITHRNVYVAPPINDDIFFDNTKGYGARYASAILCSRVDGVFLTGVVSNSYGVVIFKNGQVIKREIDD